MGFIHAITQLISDSRKFIHNYSPWVSASLLTKIKDLGLDLSICYIKGPRPSNQFVALWDEPYNELKPFGLNVSDYATHRTKIIEWEFPTLKFRYESPYCSIDSLKILDTLEHRFKGNVTLYETKLQDVHISKESVTCRLIDGSNITSRVFVDACGYGSLLNAKYHLNEHSPIYQMLMWKFPQVHGYDKDINNIWFKPRILYNQPPFNLNDRVAGWFHPISDGIIIGASKYLYRPLSRKILSKLLEPYLNEYIRIRNWVPDGQKQVFQGIGVLYNPNHYLRLPRVLQLGDARRIPRPATGYGFIPALWHSLFGVISTGLAFKHKRFTFRALDALTMKLFNFRFFVTYGFEYLIQQLYLNGDWVNVQNFFSILDKIRAKIPPGFFDRLTMSQFRRKDAFIALPSFIETFILRRKLPLRLPPRVLLDCMKSFMLQQLCVFNPIYR